MVCFPSAFVNRLHTPCIRSPLMVVRSGQRVLRNLVITNIYLELFFSCDCNELQRRLDSLSFNRQTTDQDG